MPIIAAGAPLAVAVTEAIQTGDLASLRRLLREHPELASARLGDPGDGGESRTLLHVATDWPGHFPNGPAVVAALVEAGADVDARFVGAHAETPLHWAASSDDVEVLDALVDAGADPPTPEEVTDAFWQACHGGQRQTAEYLLDRGADRDWVGWDNRTPLDIAEAQGADEVVRWLRSEGARPAAELR